jgi:hypothetical protein
VRTPVQHFHNIQTHAKQRKMCPMSLADHPRNLPGPNM